MPLRHLVKLHTDFAAEATGLRAKLNEALSFAQQVIDSGALYFRGNPAVGERLKKMSEQDRNYLAHEYFNRDWRMMAFSDVARWLDDAKLSFVASAQLLDHVDAVNLSEAGLKLLSGISHPLLQHLLGSTLRDDQQHREPARQLTQVERGAARDPQPPVAHGRAALFREDAEAKRALVGRADVDLGGRREEFEAVARRFQPERLDARRVVPAPCRPACRRAMSRRDRRWRCRNPSRARARRRRA